MSAARSAAMRLQWADPELRAKRSASMRAAYANPALREVSRQNGRKAWSNAAGRPTSERRRTCFHCGMRRSMGRLAPVAGLVNEYECKAVLGCEQRILARA